MLNEFYAEMDIDQVRALKRAISAASAEARRELRRQLRSVGMIIKESIDELTPVYQGTYSMGRRRVEFTLRSKGGETRTYRARHSPGLLKRSNRIVVGRLWVAVRNTAKAVSPRYPRGYRYGKRLEFDPKFSGRYAFFYPGYERVKGRAQAAFKSVLEAAARAFRTTR